MVLEKDPQNYSCADRLAQSHAGHGQAQRILKGQEGHCHGQALVSLKVWVLLNSARDIFLLICGKKVYQHLNSYKSLHVQCMKKDFQ